MSENPFKIIAPREELSSDHKREVIGSVKSIILVLRFVQLFVGDFTSVLLDKFKTDVDQDSKTNYK